MALATGLKVGGMVLGLGVMGMLGYMVVKKQPSTEAEKSAAAPKPEIIITTKNAIPLTFQLSTATEDICFKRQPKDKAEINLLDPVFLAYNKWLGFTRAMKFSDGSISTYAYPDINTPSTGHGYNGKESDFPTRLEWQEWGGGVLYYIFPSDFFNKTTEFTNALGVKSDVALNKKNTWAQNKYLIDNSTGEYIKLASEVITLKAPVEMSASQYIAWANSTKDSIKKYYGLYSESNPTGKKLIVDEPVLYKINPKATDWRRDVNPTSIPEVYGGDVYWQVDDQVSYTPNQDSNLIKSRLFFDSIVPAQIAQFQSEFPGWKIIAGEVQLEDNRESNIVYVKNNMVEAWTWAAMFQMFIENQAIQPMGIQMSLKNLQKPEDVRPQSIAMLNKLLNPSFKVTAVEFKEMAGVDGLSLNNSSNVKEHTLLIRNTSNVTYTFTKVTIDGKPKTPSTYKIQRQYSDNWSNVVTRDSTSSSTLIILPISVSVVTFTTGTGSQPASLK